METWDYKPTDDFDKTPIERLSVFPRQPDMFWYGVRFVVHAFLRVWLAVYHRYRVKGRAHLPKDQPFVMVSNHSSHLDALCLLSALPLTAIQKTYPAAAKDYFFTTLPKVAFSAIVVNAMPFDRKQNPRESIDLCRDLLATPGHALILFPEGTRGTTGELAPFKPGIGYLTAGTNIPVVPCYLAGAFRAWPKGAWIPRPFHLTLRIGEPMTFTNESNPKRVAAALEEAVKGLRVDESSSRQAERSSTT
ncbi:MAG TPA: lysophospholipid acyltransferase family protein [Thermoanaerobaculia bacterium]|nr:lysophospholipid acyltransferase family protein [Thermoanaerobaculia bacterium]